MFGNRHLVVALLVAPLLALLAWFAVGNLVSERAAPAQAGESYPLVAGSNCRYESGQCDLENADLKLSLRYDNTYGDALELRASHALDTVLLAVAGAESDPEPQQMQPLGGDGRDWRLQLAGRPDADAQLRLVAAAGGARYFAETTTRFLQQEE